MREMAARLKEPVVADNKQELLLAMERKGHRKSTITRGNSGGVRWEEGKALSKEQVKANIDELNDALKSLEKEQIEKKNILSGMD